MRVSITVDGRGRDLEVQPRVTLADLLRDRLRLTSVHLGCEHGVCGACTVLLAGEAVRSCLVLGVQADGQAVTTAAALRDATRLQDAFLGHQAFQCGFCTPGFLVSAQAILDSGRPRSREELRELLSGNLCRCTGYEPILEAVHECQP